MGDGQGQRHVTGPKQVHRVSQHPVVSPVLAADAIQVLTNGARAVAGVDIILAAIPFANHTFNFYAAGTIGDQASLTITQNYLAHRILA